MDNLYGVWMPDAYSARDFVLFLTTSNKYFYSGILGNVIVASSISALIFLVSLVAGRPLSMLYPICFLFCYILAKEIIWDIHDAEGDCFEGIVTIANRWGTRIAFSIVWVLVGMLRLMA